MLVGYDYSSDEDEANFKPDDSVILGEAPVSSKRKASQITSSFVPKILKESLVDLDTVASYQPTKRMKGSLFDVLPQPKNRFGVVLFSLTCCRKDSEEQTNETQDSPEGVVETKETKQTEETKETEEPEREETETNKGKQPVRTGLSLADMGLVTSKPVTVSAEKLSETTQPQPQTNLPAPATQPPATKAEPAVAGPSMPSDYGELFFLLF